MKKQPQLTAITRQNIAEAFWSLYVTRPIGQITVKEVIEKAGYNRATFYEYFPNVQAVLDHIEDSLIESMKEIVRGGPDITSTDADAIARIERLYAARGEYLCVLFSANGDPGFQSKFKAMVKPFLLDAFAVPEEVRNLRTEVVYEFAISSIIAAFSLWYPQREQLPAEEFILLLRSMLMRGVVAELTRKQKA